MGAEYWLWTRRFVVGGGLGVGDSQPRPSFQLQDKGNGGAGNPAHFSLRSMGEQQGKTEDDRKEIYIP